MGKPKYGKSYQKKVKVSSGKVGGAPIRSGKMKASHILIDKLSKAQELYEDLKVGGNFENLARQFSKCSSKKRGGNLGEFGKGDMVPEFWNACIELKIGEISRPIKSQFGYHIIKRNE
ncbi:MAG: peptidylprolyl isomerase [Promethearchaeota archaeon]